MAIPDVTHLQFLVLSILGTNELPGRTVRKELSNEGAKKTTAAFYQVMSRLEDAGYVRGRYKQKAVHGQKARERWYKITGEGCQVCDEAWDFYMTRWKSRAPDLESLADVAVSPSQDESSRSLSPPEGSLTSRHAEVSGAKLLGERRESDDPDVDTGRTETENSDEGNKDWAVW